MYIAKQLHIIEPKVTRAIVKCIFFNSELSSSQTARNCLYDRLFVPTLSYPKKKKQPATQNPTVISIRAELIFLLRVILASVSDQ